MPLINATWRVTHAGVVLLDFGEQMQNEPELDRSFVNDNFASLSGSGKSNIGRQNLFHTAAFSRVKVFDDDNEARTFMEEHTVSVSGAPADCLIEWLNTGAVDTLQNAVLTTYRARCENNWFMADYSLQGGLLIAAGFTPPPPPSSGGVWRLVDVVGPPDGVKLQVKNSSDVWEDVWTYTASS